MTDSKTMRAWLRTNGFQVGDRGRLHPTMIRKYEAAHKVAPAPKPEAPRATKGLVDYICGWCGTGDCHGCREVTRNGVNAQHNNSDLIWCRCALKGHKENNARTVSSGSVGIL
jgi:hypothetical protein